MLAAAMGTMAYAGSEIMSTSGGGTPALTWEQFKDSCLHPEQFNNQTPPKDIKIQCTDVQREFVTTSPGQLPLPGNRKVIYAVFSNKYHVNADQREEPILNKGGSCLKFKEVERTITVERKLTCDDILGIKSELAEYCSSVLSISKGANPKLVDSHDTGRFIDTCGSSGIADPGKGKPNA
jgi:hypothetical protein